MGFFFVFLFLDSLIQLGFSELLRSVGTSKLELFHRGEKNEST